MTDKKKKKKLYDEPVQSDATLIMKVEDLIHMAMGPPDLNIVNFKLVETVLYILARQMRMLEQKVEIRVGQELARAEEEEEAEAPRKGRADTRGRGKDSEKVTRDRGDKSKDRGRDKSRDKSQDKIRAGGKAAGRKVVGEPRGGEEKGYGTKGADTDSIISATEYFEGKSTRGQEYTKEGKRLDEYGREIDEDDSMQFGYQTVGKKKEGGKGFDRTGESERIGAGGTAFDSRGYKKKTLEGETYEERKETRKMKSGRSEDVSSDEVIVEGKKTSRKVKEGKTTEERKGYSTSKKETKGRSDAVSSDEYDDETKKTGKKVKESKTTEERKGYSYETKTTSKKDKRGKRDEVSSDEYDEEGKKTSRGVKETITTQKRGYTYETKTTTEEGKGRREDAEYSDEDDDERRKTQKGKGYTTEEKKGYSYETKTTSETVKGRRDEADSDEYDDEGKKISEKVRKGKGYTTEEKKGYSYETKTTSEKVKGKRDEFDSDEYDDEGKKISEKARKGKGYTTEEKRYETKGRRDEYDVEGKKTTRGGKEGETYEERRSKKTREEVTKTKRGAEGSDEEYAYQEGKRKRRKDEDSKERERSEKGRGASKARRLEDKVKILESEGSESPERGESPEGESPEGGEGTSSSPDADSKGTGKKSTSPDKGRKGRKGKFVKGSRSDIERKGGRARSAKGRRTDESPDAEEGGKEGSGKEGGGKRKSRGGVEDRGVGDEDEELDAEGRGGEGREAEGRGRSPSKGRAAKGKGEKGMPDEDEEEYGEGEGGKAGRKKGRDKRAASETREAADKRKGRKDRSREETEGSETEEGYDERGGKGRPEKGEKGKAEKGKAAKGKRDSRFREESEEEERYKSERYKSEERGEKGERDERGRRVREEEGKLSDKEKDKKKKGRGKGAKEEAGLESGPEEDYEEAKTKKGKGKADKETTESEKGRTGKGKKGEDKRTIEEQRERAEEQKGRKGRKKSDIAESRREEGEIESSSETEEGEFAEGEGAEDVPRGRRRGPDGAPLKGDAEKGAKSKGRKEKEKEKYGTTVKDVSRDGEKVLAIGKGKKKGDDGKMRVGSVEVVSQKEFDALEEKVKALQGRVSLPPTPTMPDNAQLRSDIARGSATLTDTMQAMQLWARVEAAEKAVDAMAELLAQLIASGALPPEVADMADTIKAEVDTIRQDLTVAQKGATEGDIWKKGAGPEGGEKEGKKKYQYQTKVREGTVHTYGADGGMYDMRTKQSGTTIMADAASSGLSSTLMPHSMVSGHTSTPATASGKGMIPFEGKQCVTHSEMVAALQHLREEIIKKIGDETAYAAATAENASSSVKGIVEKMDIAMKLDERMSFLQSLVNDYSEQLAGFDAGLNTQIAGFQDQMAQIRVDLTAGLAQLENVNSNAETAAILELTERYEELVVELDQTLMQHQEISAFQKSLTEELRSLIEAVEMMREEKADRDEVLDGLRDKADSSRLEGLLTEEKFNKAREELENRMQLCYEKFHRQDAVWMNVVDDFTRLVEGKAELVQLLSLHDHTQDALRDLNDKVHQLACLLGEPKAAILTRKLAKDGTCAVCRVPALMDPAPPIQPARLPAARPRPDGAPAEPEPEPCLRGFKLPEREPPENQHLCQRWVGGSHTMIGPIPGIGNVSRDRAQSVLQDLRPTKKYYGTGNDGKLYKFEEELECVPCVECNVPEKAGDTCTERIPGAADTQAPGRGAGDEPVEIVNVVYAQQAALVKVVDDRNLEQLGDRPEQRGRAASEQRGRANSRLSERTAQLIGEVTQLPDGATELFPSQRKRASEITHVEIFGAENVINMPAEIGSSVKGQPGVSQEQYERRQIMKQIEADQDLKDKQFESA